MIAYIEALAALADQGTMGKAGMRLRITQSAVSKRIAALETELGKKLVERRGRRLKLTPAGVRLLEKAEQQKERGRDCSPEKQHVLIRHVVSTA